MQMFIIMEKKTQIMKEFYSDIKKKKYFISDMNNN